MSRQFDLMNEVTCSEDVQLTEDGDGEIHDAVSKSANQRTPESTKAESGHSHQTTEVDSFVLLCLALVSHKVSE